MSTPDPDAPKWEGPFHILALDGGGIRGLFSASVLAKFEEDHRTSIVDHFDLIVGTSTGGILALGLGMGLSPAELVRFYVTSGSSIFPSRDGWMARARHLIRSARRHRYDNAALQAALRGVFGDRLLGASTKRLVIPAYDLGRDAVRLFKTPHHFRLKRDWRSPAWQVAMATSAAPTYFPAWRGIEGTRLIDGGVWANNPTMVGIIEATSLLGVSLNDLRVLSLGTCDDLVSRPDKLDTGGLLAWCPAAIDVIMRGQSIGTDNLASLLLGRDRVRRLDPTVPHGLFALDRTTTADKLVAEAAHASLHFSPKFALEFLPHRAKEYAPLYGLQQKGTP